MAPLRWVGAVANGAEGFAAQLSLDAAARSRIDAIKLVRNSP